MAEHPSRQVDEQSSDYPTAPREQHPRAAWNDGADLAELYYAAQAGDELAQLKLERGY